MHRTFTIACLLVGLCSATHLRAEESGTPDVMEIMQHCYNKYAGDDQRTQLHITLVDAADKKINYEFLRHWKDYKGQGGIADKTILYTRSPSDSRGINFLRVSYTDVSKPLDQWIYMPDLRTVRRLSQRDQQNMDWGFVDEDLRVRALNEDEHRYIETVSEKKRDYYVVESIPKGRSSYGKRVTWFSKTPDWNDCTESRVSYYDSLGLIIKKQALQWQKIKDAWVWKTVTMENMERHTFVVYDLMQAEANTGLKDDDFSQRALKREGGR